MSSRHLDDEVLQQLALNKAGEGDHAHLDQCAECREKMEGYRQLFTAIREQDKPSFDFDLAGTVMAQLPAKRVHQPTKKPILLPVFLIIVTIAALYFIFRNRLDQLFSDISPIAIAVLITSISSLLLLLLIDMFREYRTKMQQLNTAG